MRGDGVGRLRGKRHGLRFGFYAALALVAAAGQPLLAASAWTAYCAASIAARWPAAAAGRPLGVQALSLLALPPLLAAMDAAKLSGYLTGRMARA
jgi:hypothetical protein